MSGHTPGPWRAEQDSDDYLRINADGVDYPIADLGTVNEADYPTDVVARLRADAALIAAAPSMLEAIDYLLRRIKDDPRVAWHFGHTESLALLTSAHALATGIASIPFHNEFQKALRTEPPRCRSGECYERAAT
jgi:hypothetical protein